MSPKLIVDDCLDSDEIAEARRAELDISGDLAMYRTRAVKHAVEVGVYKNSKNNDVDWRDDIIQACLAKQSIPPWHELSAPPVVDQRPTRVQVRNETTLAAALRYSDQGMNPLVLNFANGRSPGGGFLTGARAQEETLCRCSSLYWTLLTDPMYLYHCYHDDTASSDWAIVSPQVPFFCDDLHLPFDKPKLIDIITSAAPYAPGVGQPRSRELLKIRIHRILHIANSLGYRCLVLGAWGCGAFENDPRTTAEDFKAALSAEFSNGFSDVVFAIADWSHNRRFLGPFRDVFQSQ